MKRRLNKDIAASDPTKYDAALVAFHYLYEVPVANGARYLDARIPGWARLIDEQTFNMRYTGADILAQVYKVDTRDTDEFREWSDRILRAHGMLAAYGELHAYDSLTLAWMTEIQNRRNEVGK